MVYVDLDYLRGGETSLGSPVPRIDCPFPELTAIP